MNSNRKIGHLLAALGALGFSTAPVFEDTPRVICADCGGTDKTGCLCEPKVMAVKAKAQAKRDRKNAARLAEVQRGTLRAGGA